MGWSLNPSKYFADSLSMYALSIWKIGAIPIFLYMARPNNVTQIIVSDQIMFNKCLIERLHLVDFT